MCNWPSLTEKIKANTHTILLTKKQTLIFPVFFIQLVLTLTELMDPTIAECDVVPSGRKNLT